MAKAGNGRKPTAGALDAARAAASTAPVCGQALACAFASADPRPTAPNDKQYKRQSSRPWLLLRIDRLVLRMQLTVRARLPLVGDITESEQSLAIYVVVEVSGAGVTKRCVFKIENMQFEVKQRLATNLPLEKQEI